MVSSIPSSSSHLFFHIHSLFLSSSSSFSSSLTLSNSLILSHLDGIHNWNQYTCVIGNVTAGNNNRAKRESALSTSDDALVAPPGFCYAANATHGCLNGVPYNWNVSTFLLPFLPLPLFVFLFSFLFSSKLF
jgi:hypothetical protein